MVSKELDKRVELDLPRKREGVCEGELSYDEIPAKFHNPFEVLNFVKDHGFSNVKIHWYHYHPAPPFPQLI